MVSLAELENLKGEWSSGFLNFFTIVCFGNYNEHSNYILANIALEED